MPALTNKQPPAKNPPIDWDAFTDGKQRTCKHGKDFFGSAANLQHRARHAAERRGMKATTFSDGKDVVVQFVQRE